MGRELPVNSSGSSAQEQPTFEKIRVALISVGAALFLTTLKAVVGVLTGSLALLAEAAHSGLDLVASLVTALSVRAADRPPDKTHHYGHGKIESLSALFEALLLLVTCFWILWEAFHRLVEVAPPPQITIYSFLVVATAIIVDFYRYRVLKKTADKHQSQALEADAIHFLSDIISSLLVMVGLAAVSLGYRWADAVAAICVAIWVGVLSVRLGLKNLNILIDRVPEEYIDRIHQVVFSVDGVVSIDKLRLRRAGSTVFADLRIGIDRTMSFNDAHERARVLEKELAAQIKGLDVIVHTNPRSTPNESLEMGIIHFLQGKGFRAHHLSFTEAGDGLAVELHLEMDGDLLLSEAYARIDQLKEGIKQQFNDICHIQIHLENLSNFGCEEIPLEGNELVEQINQICQLSVECKDSRVVSLTRRGDAINVNIHCRFHTDKTIEEVHQATTELERSIHKAIPELDHIFIHAQPPESS